MARYIDAYKLIEDVKRGGHALSEWSTLGVCAAIDRQPTADVVPKSEVEKLKIAYEGSQKTIKGLTEMIREKTKELAKLETHLELHYGQRSLNNLIAEERADVAREIFEEIEKLVVSRKLKKGLFGDLLESDIAELKKKYIGESDVKRDTV